MTPLLHGFHDQLSASCQRCFWQYPQLLYSDTESWWRPAIVEIKCESEGARRRSTAVWQPWRWGSKVRCPPNVFPTAPRLAWLFPISTGQDWWEYICLLPDACPSDRSPASWTSADNAARATPDSLPSSLIVNKTPHSRCSWPLSHILTDCAGLADVPIPRRRGLREQTRSRRNLLPTPSKTAAPPIRSRLHLRNRWRPKNRVLRITMPTTVSFSC